ncbi:MAG: nucleoside monophosphate kinase [bacterium]
MSSHIVLLGPPASGKGVQSRLLSQRMSIPRISTGELIRDVIKKNTTLSTFLEDIINAGNLIPDNILVELLMNKLKSINFKKGLIADGFPRTVTQAETFERLGFFKETNRKVFVLVADKNVLTDRLSKRAKEEHRQDDNSDVFQNRYNLYLKHLRELKKYYTDLVEINAETSVEKVNEQIVKYLCK